MMLRALFIAAVFLAPAAQADEPCRLLSIQDGDTITCRTDKGAESIRVAYLDCPEIGHRGGYDASLAMGRLLTGEITLKPRPQPSPSVSRRCVRPGYCDHFGRTVASVYAKTHDVARQLIASGTCREYCRFSVRDFGRGGKYGTCP